MVPIVADVGSVAWANVALFALLVLSVSTEIGNYWRALDAIPYWSDARQREGRRVVTRAALELILVLLVISSVFTYGVARATEGMDSRMILVLEGLSRLEASLLMFVISVRTPQWIGVYHSPKRDRDKFNHHVQRGLKVLRLHVQCSIFHHFIFAFFFLLPFAGKPVSFVIGVFAGFVVDGCMYIARRRKQERVKLEIALCMALVLAVLSAGMFANGCNYIQTVWGTGIWRNELGLRITSFSIWFTVLLLVHGSLWRRTEKKLMTERRFTAYDTKDRLAVSLILSRMFKSRLVKQISSFSLDQILEEDEEDEEEDEEPEPLTASDAKARGNSLNHIQEEDGDDDGGREAVTAKGAEASGTASSKHMEEEDLSAWSIIKMRCNTPAELGLTRGISVFLILLCIVSLFLVIVNIGSTAQMNIVKENFPAVHKVFYEEMDEGPVCAFDKIGGIIKTFDSQKAARRSGFKVAHCGACGACSDWHNLRLQYTTRKYLAKESARCARKSLTGGRDAVLSCLQKPPVGFQGKCAECWTEDILCARGNCAFIFLQSLFINTMTNFEVGHDTITSATCEEAMCELEFVPCSGANRRRMNIRSTIDRPGTQSCGIVDGDWAVDFGDGTVASQPLGQQATKVIGSNEQEL